MNRACVGMEMSSSHCGVTHGRPRRGLRVRPASGASFDELCGVPNISDAHKYCMLQHGLSVAQLGASPMPMRVIGQAISSDSAANRGGTSRQPTRCGLLDGLRRTRAAPSSSIKSTVARYTSRGAPTTPRALTVRWAASPAASTSGAVNANSLKFPVGIARAADGVYTADRSSNHVLFFAGNSSTAPRVLVQTPSNRRREQVVVRRGWHSTAQVNCTSRTRASTAWCIMLRGRSRCPLGCMLGRHSPHNTATLAWAGAELGIPHAERGGVQPTACCSSATGANTASWPTLRVTPCRLPRVRSGRSLLPARLHSRGTRSALVPFSLSLSLAVPARVLRERRRVANCAG